MYVGIILFTKNVYEGGRAVPAMLSSHQPSSLHAPWPAASHPGVLIYSTLIKFDYLLCIIA